MKWWDQMPWSQFSDFSSLIPTVSMFSLAISCLTTCNLPWFMYLTFQVPVQYCSLQLRTLLPSPVTSTTGWCFHFVSGPSFFLEVFFHSSPVVYWAPTDLGSSSFRVRCRYTYVAPPSWTPLPSTSQPHPSRLSHSTRLSSLCQTAHSHLLSVLHTLTYMFLGKLVLSKVRLRKVKGFPQGLYTCNLQLGHESRCFWLQRFHGHVIVSLSALHVIEKKTRRMHYVKSHDSFYLLHGTILIGNSVHIKSSLTWY